MAALNFPSSPTNGQEYISGDKSWVYDSATTSWLSMGSPTPVPAFTLSGTDGTIYSTQSGDGGTGEHNFFVGSSAGNSTTSGIHNTFIGQLSGTSNTIGQQNNFIGQQTGQYNTEGSGNNFLGKLVGVYNTTGSYNNFFGIYTGASNTTGSDNTFLGRQAGFNNTVGNKNTFIGYASGFNNTLGSYNVFIGDDAGNGNTEGTTNTFIGKKAGFYNTTGTNNVFVGAYAGQYNTTTSNLIVMGNGSHTSAEIQVSWTVLSDVRDKCVFGPVTHGRDFLSNITPIEYAFKNRETGKLTDPDNKTRYGFSAQEVLQAEGDHSVIVNTDNPDKLKITTDYLIPILVNAIKELSAEVDQLKSRLTSLEQP